MILSVRVLFLICVFAAPHANAQARKSDYSVMSNRFLRVGARQNDIESSSTLITESGKTSSQRRTACASRSPPPIFEGKKGVCAKNITRVNMVKPHWNHNWTNTISKLQPDSVEYVPMLWSGKDLKSLQSRLKNIKSQTPRPRRLLGFNEPDNPNQADMTVQQALAGWPYLEATGLPLVSPSCVHPTGTWMTEFMQQVDAACMRVDYIGVHWYGGASFDSFKSSMQAVYNTYGNRSLVISEFAVADWKATSAENNKFSAAAVLNFARQALPWLEQQPWIVGYAWFPFNIRSAPGTSSALFDTRGNLTPLGKYYASVRANNPNGNQTISI